MRLLVDCGNTRLKWMLVRGQNRIEDSLAWEDFLPQELAEDWQQAASDLGAAQDHPRGGLCSVAPAPAAAKAWSALEAFCASAGVYRLTPRGRFRLQRDGLAVELRNPYHQPETLGSDRWAAAIGLLAELFRLGELGQPAGPQTAPGTALQGLLGRDRLELGLVSVGTATVMDRLRCQRGPRGWDCELQPGAILPGLRVSAQALATAAPALRTGLLLALDRPSLLSGPASTEQALARGLAAAQIGPLLWTDREQPLDAVWVHGGDADWWQSALRDSPWRQECPVLHSPLIFQGLWAAMWSECAQ